MLRSQGFFSEMIGNIPNALTFLRLALVPAVIFWLDQGRYDWAFYGFLAAAVSDGLDGFLARALNQQTPLGAALDPVADKLMLVSTAVMLAWMEVLPLWVGIAILTRDVIIVAGAVSYHRVKGNLEISPTRFGKFNTFLEFGLITLVLADLSILLEIPADLLYHLFWLVFLSTVASGGQYVWIWGKKAAGPQEPAGGRP
jgi:cardiolipin synthase (CMP-forming)